LTLKVGAYEGSRAERDTDNDDAVGGQRHSKTAERREVLS
jgi:hypothetical protein